MTWSARPSIDGGMVSLSALAVFMLITSSNLVGCSIGKSAGLAPLRILSTNVAERRYMSATFGPYIMSPPASMYSFKPYIAGSRFLAAKPKHRIGPFPKCALEGPFEVLGFAHLQTQDPNAQYLSSLRLFKIGDIHCIARIPEE